MVNLIFCHGQLKYFVLLLLVLIKSIAGDLWSQLELIGDLSEFKYLCNQYPVCRAYMSDSNAKITAFLPVDDVFIYNPDLRGMEQMQTLNHIVDSQVPDITYGTKWDKATLIRTTTNQGNVYLVQYEHNPNNFSYFANNGRICNHVSSNWHLRAGEQFLYKVCTDLGQRAFPGPALSLIRMDDPTFFDQRTYHNRDLREIKDILARIPDVAMVIFGSNAWQGFHTFFIPNDDAFRKIPDRRLLDREVLLAHVTGANRVLFTHSWLYDGGIHFYPSLKFTTNLIEDNFKLKLSIRNITDRKTGRWDTYAVSEVYERYSTFRRGAVWAKIVTPNIPVQNGVVHIIDRVLGVVSNTIDQLLMQNEKVTSLMIYINTVGQIVRNYFSANAGMVTFFAPVNEAFDRIPEVIEKRLLRDRIWLEQILKLHIVPGKEFTSAEIQNDSRVNTVDQLRQLYFVRGEWPRNNITYYVYGGGVRAVVLQDNVAGTNGIIHYIDRVLGVPYQTMFEIIRNESQLQTSYNSLRETHLRFTLDPWEVVKPNQNFTFFVPTDEAWAKVPAHLRRQFFDSNHRLALNFIYKRHIIQGQSLMLTDLRERTYIMMNHQKVVLRRRLRTFELYWPQGNRVARIIEGGEIAAINGFMHKIDNVLILDEDLSARGENLRPPWMNFLLSFVLVFIVFIVLR